MRYFLATNCVYLQEYYARFEQQDVGLFDFIKIFGHFDLTRLGSQSINYACLSAYMRSAF